MNAHDDWLVIGLIFWLSSAVSVVAFGVGILAFLLKDNRIFYTDPLIAPAFIIGVVCALLACWMKYGIN